MATEARRLRRHSELAYRVNKMMQPLSSEERAKRKKARKRRLLQIKTNRK